MSPIYEFQAKTAWQTRDLAQKAADNVGKAIKRLHLHLATATEAGCFPHPVLRPFADHLRYHLLIPSGRTGRHGGPRSTDCPGGCFTYQPPLGVVWVR
jgi:hypothetical protein